MIRKAENPLELATLFEGSHDTAILSCLQGVMGELYVTSPNPVSAMALLGDFVFFGGEPSEELVRFVPPDSDLDFSIMVAPNESWNKLIERCYGETAERVERYALKKESNCFDKGKLEILANTLPDGYSLRSIDREMYEQCLQDEWSEDLVASFKSYESYQQLALGVVVVYNGRIVGGASTYSRYLEGIEIEIDTLKDHRRKGLATACGAKLILDCLNRGLYPSWDAQNKASVALAEKLGYHFSHCYPAYEVDR